MASTDPWRRRVVESSPGLYFVGLPFLYAFASMFIGGVGRDAEYVGKHIAKRMESGLASRQAALNAA